MPAWLADALCRLATGSGFATRMLHTDRDEMIFEAARPIIINGITHLTDRADLADRSVTIHLAAIPDAERQPEDELLADFEAARPHILGALLDAVSRALANIATVRLDRAPRMADFAKWITAAEPGLGCEPGAFLAAYAGNRRDVVEAAFEADAVAVAIWKMITTDRPEGFQGTATELLTAINNIVPETTRKSRYWPENAAQLGNRIARATPLFKARGCTIERRHSGARIITIVPPRTGLTMAPTAKGFTAVMAQRREPPDALDYFPTPPWATRALFRHVLPALGIEAIGRVWEPACGEGHMAAVIAEFARGPGRGVGYFQLWLWHRAARFPAR